MRDLFLQCAYVSIYVRTCRSHLGMKTSFFEGAAPSIRFGVVAVTTEQELDRDFSPTPIEEAEKRHRDHSRGGDNWRNRNSLCRDSLFGEHFL